MPHAGADAGGSDQIEEQRSDTMTRSSLNLSIVATVFLPLSFITGLLGMNVEGIPEEHNPLGFWLVTGLSIIISVVAWRWLRRKTYDRYLPQVSVGKKVPERSGETHLMDDAGLSPAVMAVKWELTKHLPPIPDAEVGRQDKSGGTKVDRPRTVSHSKLVGVHVFALLLALVLFLFHAVIIIDVAGELIRREAWLLAHFGQHAGKVALLGCFFCCS